MGDLDHGNLTTLALVGVKADALELEMWLQSHKAHDSITVRADGRPKHVESLRSRDGC